MLQKYRVWKGLLQRELAEATGLSLTAIRTIESGKVEPRKATKEKLAKYFELNEAQLFPIKVKLPILNLEWATKQQQVSKMIEEMNELIASDYSTEEIWDVIQAAFGLLLMKDDLKESNKAHIKKLKKRNWSTKGEVEIEIRY